MLPSFTGERPVELLTAKQRARLALLRRYLLLKEYGHTLEQVAAMTGMQFMTALLKGQMADMAEAVFWSDRPSPLLAALEDRPSTGLVVPIKVA